MGETGARVGLGVGGATGAGGGLVGAEGIASFGSSVRMKQ